jgi:hypothetical protein
MPSLRPNSYSRDIDKSREEARRLLKEDRNVGQPYTAAGIYTIDQRSKIGIETEHRQLETKLFFDALARGDFDVAIDFITDHGDDPNLQYVHVLSAAMQSPMSYSQDGDANIDALFERQKRALDPASARERPASSSRAGGLRPATTSATTSPRCGSSSKHRLVGGHGSVCRWGRTGPQEGRWPQAR